jgi:Ca2+-binding EF-hand superfamily protein
MGTGQSQLRKEDLDILIQNTHFDVRELKAIFKQFRKEIVTGWISREQFKEVLKQMGVLDSFVQDLIFNAFDKNQDGMIDFQEFIIVFRV